ncbi:hypothetical protein [Leptospira interrogans]|uniref:hypothetical protein n=1 Tax=Leptospira interrogans TaxID=173 RepID=UPI0002BC0579|nr:hypothetical protein [Leptospira interrogans]EMN38360.1 hypothetical protein LEP1GSC085_0095 [Leptospira interrogans str. L0996]EMN93362.1 hypothetical protein LEP1GSC110_3552 [Leptospira interrogans serovar Medanensis str. UT053]EMO00855.1 hypothetical protein LEP1GSC112_0464 [Leptospira interrogans serovar Pomona str. UT364]MBM2890034.1 hypothetical protein [Leptospira interrogans]QOI36746.1 hypothetical protein LeptoLang_21360 [Leptospira interrogans serovar Icterohaemorrhagiae]
MMKQSDVEKNQYLVEFFVAWLKTTPAFSAYTGIIQPFVDVPTGNNESILVIHNNFAESEPFGKSQLDLMVIAKTLSRSKNIAFDLFKKLRGRFNFELPIPTSLPEGKTATDFEPIHIRKIEGNNIRLIGQVLNGEYRYNASFFIQ